MTTPEPLADRAERRRAPRYRRFVLLGATLGLVAAVIAVLVSGPGEWAGAAMVMSALGLALLGGLLGGGVAVLLDRPSR